MTFYPELMIIFGCLVVDLCCLSHVGMSPPSRKNVFSFEFEIEWQQILVFHSCWKIKTHPSGPQREGGAVLSRGELGGALPPPRRRFLRERGQAHRAGLPADFAKIERARLAVGPASHQRVHPEKRSTRVRFQHSKNTSKLLVKHVILTSQIGL